jgi:hypothetical protein
MLFYFYLFFFLGHGLFDTSCGRTILEIQAAAFSLIHLIIDLLRLVLVS